MGCHNFAGIVHATFNSRDIGIDKLNGGKRNNMYFRRLYSDNFSSIFESKCTFVLVKQTKLFNGTVAQIQMLQRKFLFLFFRMFEFFQFTNRRALSRGKKSELK